MDKTFENYFRFGANIPLAAGVWSSIFFFSSGSLALAGATKLYIYVWRAYYCNIANKLYEVVGV